jgi:hypothetical protein
MTALRSSYAVSPQERALKLIYSKTPVKKINRSMLKMLKNFSVHTEEETRLFHVLFDMLYDGYMARVQSQYPVLNAAERVIFAHLKLEMPAKMIAKNFGYSIDEVKRTTFCICKKVKMDLADLQKVAMSL